MIKKPWVISICLGLCSIIFLLIGVLTPIILTKLLEEKIKESVTLTKSNKRDFWGEAPGKLEAKIYQSFSFFNILNPEGILEGEQPLVETKGSYNYQEYDKFLDPEWHKVDGHKLVRFHLLRYTKKNHNTKWAEGLTPEDKITQVGVGAAGGWYQLKHMTRQQVALAALFQIVNGLETSLMVTAYSQAVLPLLGGYKAAQILIFDPAGISPERGKSIWYDQYYGMGGNTTISIWVQALIENLYKDEFVISHPINGTLYILWSNFGLSNDELNSIFSGHLKDAYDLTTILFYNNYECPENANNTLNCDPVYLSNLQWTYSGLTLFPPFMAGSTISVANANNTFTGYPEMYYFYESTSTRTKYGEYEFTMDDYNSLFYYNRKNNFPAYSDHTLLDVGKMNRFFEYANEGDFGSIQTMLNLSSTAKAKVLWDYINALIDFTALQGRYDPEIYNIDNRGMTQELSLGVTGSQTLYSLLVSISNSLPIVLSSIYNLIQSDRQAKSCQSLVSQILSPQKASICSLYQLEWSLSSNGISLWINTYWNDVNSTSWTKFKEISELDQSDMIILFKTNNSLTTLFAQCDLELKSNYNCTNAGPRCDPMYLTKMQWGNGLVTKNLPSVFQDLSISNSSTITNYHFLSTNWPGIPEYYGYTVKKNLAGPLTESQINYILSFEGILNPIIQQKTFLLEYERNFTEQQKLLNIPNPEILISYLRYMIDLFFFGGLFQTKTVNQILYADYNEPLLVKTKSMSPLLGGNPSINLNASSIAQNMTQDHFKNISKQMKDGMDTGQQNAKYTRRYRLYAGKEYINTIQPAYLGEGPNGPIIENVNYNPWDGEIKIGGTDGWAYCPFITKHSNMDFYVDIASVLFHGTYKKTTTVHGFKCLQRGINSNDLKNATLNPKNARYYAFGPNGLINQTSILMAPLFGSKPYFYQADKTLIKLINYSDPSSVEPEKYDSRFDIEKYTGANLKGDLQMQFNYELKPDMLYPKLGAFNLEKYGYNTYMPVFFVNRHTNLSKHICDKYFGVIHVIETVMLVGQIVGYTLAGILLIVLGLYLWRRYKKRILVKDTSLGQSLQIR